MSTLNIHRNTFLEKEELVNWQSFTGNNLLQMALMQATYSFGLIANVPNKVNGGGTSTTPPAGIIEPMVVQPGTINGSVKILPGMILTPEGKFIIVNVQDNILTTNDSAYYWLKISYDTRNYELGYVSVNVQGGVSGTVNFDGKVRGQSGSTPTVIRFEKEDGSTPLNNGLYQVANVIDSQNLILTSSSTFVPEANLRVIVLGTIPLGGVFSQEQRAGLYTYDHYKTSLVPEKQVNTPPAKEKFEFYLARIQNAGGTVNINNSIKNEYWRLGNGYLPTV